MEENNIVKYEGGVIKRISNQIEVTNKLLALSESQLIPYRKGDKWGFCDKNRIIKIPCDYDDASIFSSGFAAVKLNRKNCYINKNGELFFETNYDAIGDFKDFMAIVSLNNKYGIIDPLWKHTECLYDFPPEIINEYCAIACFEGHYGVVGTWDHKKIIVGFMYDKIEFLSDYLILCYLDGKCSVLTKDGSVLHVNFEFVSNFSEGYARFYQNGKYGFMDDNGRLVLNPDYDKFEFEGENIDESFKDGYAFVCLHGMNMYINYWGEWFERRQNEHSNELSKIFDYETFIDRKKTGIEIDHVYERAGLFNEGLVRVRSDGKFGFVNEDGKIIISCIYEDARSFREGLAWVKLERQWGVIDNTGKIVINFIYDEFMIIDDFKNGVATVTLNGKWGVINNTGRIIIPYVYDLIKRRNDSFIEVHLKTTNLKGNLSGGSTKSIQNNFVKVNKGLFDKNGKIIIDCVFNFIDDLFIDDLVAVYKMSSFDEKNIKEGYIDKAGNKYWED